MKLGLIPDLVIGDFDSIEPDLLVQLEERGCQTRRHPVDKDATDLELALAASLAGFPDRIVVLGGAGGRLDHQLAIHHQLLALAAHVRVEHWPGESLAVPLVAGDVRRFHIEGEPVGFSLIPSDRGARITLRGAEWDLDAVDLPAGTCRGVSNRSRKPDIEVQVKGGSVVIVFSEASSVVAA
jgi:thiamine pyrophosphokinase